MITNSIVDWSTAHDFTVFVWDQFWNHLLNVDLVFIQGSFEGSVCVFLGPLKIYILGWYWNLSKYRSKVTFDNPFWQLHIWRKVITFFLSHFSFCSHFIWFTFQKWHNPFWAHPILITFKKEQILFWAHSKKGIFCYEHISFWTHPKRVHSEPWFF